MVIFHRLENNNYLIVDQYTERVNAAGYLANEQEMMRIYQMCVEENVDYYCVQQGVILDWKMKRTTYFTVVYVLVIIFFLLTATIGAVFLKGIFQNGNPFVLLVVGILCCILGGVFQYCTLMFRKKADKHIELPLNTYVNYNNDMMICGRNLRNTKGNMSAKLSLNIVVVVFQFLLGIICLFAGSYMITLHFFEISVFLLISAGINTVHTRVIYNVIYKNKYLGLPFV